MCNMRNNLISTSERWSLHVQKHKVVVYIKVQASDYMQQISFQSNSISQSHGYMENQCIDELKALGFGYGCKNDLFQNC